MKTIAERLKFARIEKGWTQSQLAVASGVSTGTIGNIESGARQAKGSLPQIAEALGVRHKWLYQGEGPMKAAIEETTTYLLTSNEAQSMNAEEPLGFAYTVNRAGVAINLIEDIYPAEFSIPLLSWVRAGEFCEAPGQFTREDAQELLPRPLFRVGVNTFALQVVGDSMDAPGGYREGEIVYIDPDVAPTPGRDVLAKTGDKMTLKRYKVDDEGPYLLQLNGNRIIRPTDWHVCGVVVYAGRRC